MACCRPGRGVARTVVIYFLAFLLIAIYHGIIFAYGGLVFTFAVETLHFSKVEATNLNSLFFGTFTAGGVASIILVALKVPLGLLMVLNVTGSLISTLVMVTSPGNPTLIWLGTGGLGASMASIYGTVYTWTTLQVPMTGMGTSVLILGISVADMAHAPVLGVLLEHSTPYLLVYYALGDVMVSCVIVAALLITAYTWKGTSIVAMETMKEDTGTHSNVGTDDDGDCRDRCDEHRNGCGKRRTFIIPEWTSEPYVSPMAMGMVLYTP